MTNVPVRGPVGGASGTCRILHLDLGPLDQTLLGLHVHLIEVVLDITAQQGAASWGICSAPLRTCWIMGSRWAA